MGSGPCDICKYIKPVPEGELAGVLDGGITNKEKFFNWKDEAHTPFLKAVFQSLHIK